MKSYRCSNVVRGTLLRAENSSGDELPVPGDYRTGGPEGGIMSEVSWTSDTCGWCIRVSRSIPNNFRVRNKFIRVLLQYRTNHRTNGPEGGGSMIGKLEGGGRPTNSVLLFIVFF